MRRSINRVTKLIAASLPILALTLGQVAKADAPFVAKFNKISTFASTVPTNGDVNPYGIAKVPHTMGSLEEGDLLVSNFNNFNNLQGTGTTIVKIKPNGQQSLFAQIDPKTVTQQACPGGIGLTTALTVLKSGWVIVGSLPATNGVPTNAQAGCLLVLDSNGHVVKTITNGINGPWDLTALDSEPSGDNDSEHEIKVFVTNVLNGAVNANFKTINQGTVVRLDLKVSEHEAPSVESSTVIGTGFANEINNGALVIGPTGLALDAHETLFVADTLNNRIAAIPDAIDRKSPVVNGGTDVSRNGSLNQPLGMALAPNGDILTVNGNDGKLVETTPEGKQVGVVQLDGVVDTAGLLPGAGNLFNLFVDPDKGIFFVNDGTNTLNLFHYDADAH